MDFCADDRGQAIQIGAVLLFGIAVIAFSSYQAFAIPAQNKEVEFNHMQTVENEMVTLRSQLVEARRSGGERSASVTLGTQYPSRLAGLNPPNPSGSLRTVNDGQVELGGLTLSESALCTGSDGNTLTSSSLVYTPNYHELQSFESISYENTFLTETHAGRRVTSYEDLVRTDAQGHVEKLDLVLLTGEVSTSGSQRVTLEFNGSGTNTTVVETTPGDTFTLTVPSRYPPSYWEEEILEDVDVTATDNAAGDADRVDLEFTTTDSLSIACTVVGVDSDPAYRPRSGITDDNDDGEGINPAAPGDIKFESAELIEGRGNTVERVDLEFSNLGETDRTISQARLNFYNRDSQGNSGDNKNPPSEADISDDFDSDPSETLQIGGRFKDVSNLGMTVPGLGEETFELRFNRDVSSDDWFILTLQYDNGETGQYFISVP